MKTERELKQYRKEYYEKNKEYFLKYQKELREMRKRNCIYRIIDKKNNVIYVGSTQDIYNRVYQHHANNSKILLKDNYKNYKYSHFEVAYLNKNITRSELYFIENLIIQNECPCLNKAEAYNEDNRSKFENETISNERKQELEEIANDLKFSIYEY